jgi:hypothetical protein
VESFPLMYLGLPLGAPHKDPSIWNTVIEKMESKLAGWKRIYLSKCGRLTLIKSTLSNIPTLSIFVSNHSESGKENRKNTKISCGGGVGDEFKFHLVNWSKVFMNTEVGD